MEYNVKKMDAAVDQLDWAIRLFLDHRAYISSITLAGAAEEIMGAPLAQAAAFHGLRQTLAGKYKMPASLLTQEHLNRAKNWLKHWAEMGENEYTCLELETGAIQYILRAISNLVAYDKSLTSESPRFLDWLYENRRDLYGF